MRDMTITANAIENLLNTYANHKAMVNKYIEEVDYDVDKLESDAEFMYHNGFCESSERWIRCLGMSPESPVIEQMIQERM